jgi:hypothetical protein
MALCWVSWPTAAWRADLCLGLWQVPGVDDQGVVVRPDQVSLGVLVTIERTPSPAAQPSGSILPQHRQRRMIGVVCIVAERLAVCGSVSRLRIRV